MIDPGFCTSWFFIYCLIFFCLSLGSLGILEGSWYLELSTQVSIIFYIYIHESHLCNSKRAPGCWGLRRGWHHTHLYRDSLMGLDHISLGVFFGRIWKSCNENPWPSLIISSLVFDFIKGKRGLGSCGFPWMDRKELASPRHPAIPPEFWCSRFFLGGALMSYQQVWLMKLLLFKIDSLSSEI